jgi:hypothetical protein
MSDFEWVTAEQREVLAGGAWGGDWEAFLTQRVTVLLPGWEQFDEDARREWLDGVAPACALGWVTAEQQTALLRVPGDWRSWLPPILDEHWADWVHASPDVLVSWLDQWIPSLTEAEFAGEDPQRLDWVTDVQRERLAAGGDWTVWLPTKLDELWPEWTEASPEVLAGWLDDWLPTLVPEPAAVESTAPADFAEAVEQALRGVIDAGEIEPAVLQALAEDPELRAYFAAQIIEQTAEVSS